ncbi:Nif3-like dinuclear metal center hexameric protein [Leucobacter sp. CSA2]|uniref:GTP cyclohydrolase 1 type 2 homolog n=1 Tax=Leucobacter edaphi TaxID=2796472 RepID=A0A934QCE0_9MICO|nr:Nif3-like dinuclear metal center hexameric protein [Leucobacter edaphi]MBK0421255.1 Nif3-like dinuclear metal center hexameric protein [Leucobacter edaphi]
MSGAATGQHEATLADLRRVTEAFWPAATAESWDRVGLVTGRDDRPLRRVLLAVDAVAATVDEAIALGADALITHHPLLLRGVHTIAEDTGKGALLARLIRADCALIAAHTNADAPAGGVSDEIARRLGLHGTEPLVQGAPPAAHGAGLGRTGTLPEPLTLRAFAELVDGIMPRTVTGVRVAGDPERIVSRVALLGGAGDSLLDHPAVRSADVYLTSDLRHHPAQDAIELARAAGGPALVDVAHWASESLWLEGAAERLAEQLPGVEFTVSELRTDPWDFAVGGER